MKKRALGLVIMIASMLVLTAHAFASNINVNLENVINDNTVPVKFDMVEPMNIDNSTVVPLRKFCEAAGLNVTWADSNKTALITLNANYNSALPIERYAFGILSAADTKGLSLTPQSITVTMKVSDCALHIRYNYYDSENDTISLGKQIDSSVPISIVGDGSIVVPLRSLMEAFGLWVEWEPGIINVSIPPFVSPLSDLEFVAAQTPDQSVTDNNNWYLSLPEQSNTTQQSCVVAGDGSELPANAVYLGNFRISHYCTCSKCQGGWGSKTAWGGDVKAGMTIAVDPSVIPKLATVHIDGYGIRVAEDCGGAIKGNRIDVAVSSHSEAMKLGVVYKDVWLLP